MWRTIAALCGAWLLGAAAQAGGDAPGADVPAGGGDRACIERAVALLQKRYEDVRDLSAEFVQTSRSVALGSGPGGSTTSRGSVAFAKPGKMRWSYTEPEPSLVVSDGQTLSLYDPTRRELQRLPVGEGYLSGAAIQFLLGEGDVLGAFEVTANACGEEAIDLVLVPREPASYERLRVAVDPRTGDVVETEISDLLGNETEVAFAKIRVNLEPDPALFRFEPPEGVEVIDLRRESGGTTGAR